MVTLYSVNQIKLNSTKHISKDKCGTASKNNIKLIFQLDKMFFFFSKFYIILACILHKIKSNN